MALNIKMIDVARERVLDVPERTPSYRVDLVRVLVQAIKAQEQEVSEAGRRAKVTKLVEALADQVHATKATS